MKDLQSIKVEPKKSVSLLVHELSLIVVFLIPFVVGCSRHDDEFYGIQTINQARCEDSSITMSPELIPYLDSFIADCKRYGLKYDHAYCLNWMELGHPSGAQGVTDFNDCSIEINRHLADDSIGMKFVVYHELGHWFGLPHGSGIMKTSYSTRADRQWVLDNWQELLSEHFDKMKDTQ